ncbi:MAG: hypothetical protein J7M24_05910 [Candidatus Latescibacteria bacterium]|nr:hypothetical protein [Candidatus Latescibacterota bacterium]
MSTVGAQSALITIEDETISINGLDAMVQFVRYDTFDTDSFLDGLQLADDLTNRFGTVLYSSGTVITPKRISRLIKLRNANPNLELTFKLARSAVLVRKFRTEIKDQIVGIFDRHSRESLTKDFIESITIDIGRFVDELLSDDNITCLLYQMRFISRVSKGKKSNLFQEHPVNVALISLAIASSETYGTIYRRSKKKLVQLCLLALFHSYGAVSKIDEILDASDEKRFELYWSANHEAVMKKGLLPLSAEGASVLETVCDYYSGDRRCIAGDDWVSTAANIIIVADMFLSLENGLFREPLSVRKVADLLNVRVSEHVLNEQAVKALTLGLNLMDIFDFYREIKRLAGQCPFDSAVPYPLVGFLSPTIFVCSKDIRKCPHIEGSIRAVNLLRDLGELKKGRYRRCWLLTPKLINFYRHNYRSIKSLTFVSTNLKED